MVCTAVRTQILATTVCPALLATQDPNRLAKVWSRLLLRNRYSLAFVWSCQSGSYKMQMLWEKEIRVDETYDKQILKVCVQLQVSPGQDHVHLLWLMSAFPRRECPKFGLCTAWRSFKLCILPSLSRCAHLAILASMEAMTATKTHAVTTSDTLPIPCSAASASPAMLAMAISAGRTQIWMDGPMLTWFVWRMPPTTVKRYVVVKQQGSNMFQEGKSLNTVCSVKVILLVCLVLSLTVWLCCLLFRTTVPTFLTLVRKITIRTELEMLVTMMMTMMAFLTIG